MRRILRTIFAALLLVGGAASAAAPAASVAGADTLVLNVRNFGARGGGRIDDSAAFAAAIRRSNALVAAGRHPLIRIPAGTYLIDATHLPPFLHGGAVRGDGPGRTILRIGPDYSGDLFTWSETWLRGSIPTDGQPYVRQVDQTGALVRGIRVIGQPRGPHVITVMDFTDRNDLVRIDDVEADMIHGSVLRIGGTRAMPQAYMRESRISELRAFMCGTATDPCIDIDSAGNGDATNQIVGYAWDIFAPQGPGVMIHSRQGVVRNITIFGLRVEGVYHPKTPIHGDLLQIGDAGLAGRVADIDISGLQLIEPYAGSAALRITGASPATAPYGLRFVGMIGPGPGKGVVVEADAGMQFDLSGIATRGTDFTIVPSAKVYGPVRIIGAAAAGWSYAVPPVAAHLLHLDPVLAGVPGGPRQFLLTPPDGKVAGGAARGTGAVDLQSLRSAPTQVASGYAAVVVGGADNSAAGAFARAGGLGAVADGFAESCYAAGSFAAPGDAQGCSWLLRAAGRGPAAVLLTADGKPPGADNMPMVPPGAALGISVQLTARDVQDPANALTWHLPAGLLTGGAGAAHAQAASASIAAQGDGAAGRVRIGVTAAGRLTLDFVPPNAHLWHVVAQLTSVAVR